VSNPNYAWCFSHGRLHHFAGHAWCTATWTPLTGTSEAEALADKHNRYGDAQFLDQLPLEQQYELIDVPPRPTTNEEIAALPILNLNDFHEEQP
jgi:hypothetical protein